MLIKKAIKKAGRNVNMDDYFNGQRQSLISDFYKGINYDSLSDADKALATRAVDTAMKENLDVGGFKGVSFAQGLRQMQTRLRDEQGNITGALAKRQQAAKHGIDWSGMDYRAVHAADLNAAIEARNKQTADEYNKRRRTLLDAYRMA